MHWAAVQTSLCESEESLYYFFIMCVKVGSWYLEMVCIAEESVECCDIMLKISRLLNLLMKRQMALWCFLCLYLAFKIREQNV